MWFPCMVNDLGISEDLLERGWDNFTGRSCYYTATNHCKDMLKRIDPSQVRVTTGNVHSTGASNHLLEYYDDETAKIVSNLYAEDFAVLGYPLWDGESANYSLI